MPINYKKIENKKRYITIKIQTMKPWSDLEKKIDVFIMAVADEDTISDVHEFNSLAEQLKDKEAIKASAADVLKKE